MFALSFLLPLCGLLVSARGVYTPNSVLQYKRQTATCESTYGAGSEPCGGDDSGFCFSPSQGQSCCAMDSGFCDAGRYCAPVAGFCCLEGEDLESCAKNAGFELPLSVSNATATSTSSIVSGMSEASTVTGPTETVVPILKQSSTATATATVMGIQNVTCGSATLVNSMATSATARPAVLSALTVPTATVPATSNIQTVPTAISNTNGTFPSSSPSPSRPLVEVSFAVKQKCTSFGFMRMVAVIAASIMLF